jgi:phospholipid/cholesterol/gamma-HCH transport system substrate-binding protein
LERNQRLIGGIGILLIVAGTVFALLLQGGLLTPRYAVTAAFTDAAGIRGGDFVTVAGLPAGVVEDVRVVNGQAIMELAVDDEVQVPADSRAEIVIETLLGRRSVALVPGRAEQRLGDGAEIPVERTTTPVDIIRLNDISVELLEASDADAFEQLMAELTTVTEGKEQEVRTLITGLNDVLAAVNSRRNELEGLIDSLRTLSATLAGRDQRIVSLIDNLNVVLANLAARQEDITTLLENTDVASHETADLVRRNRPTIDQALTHLHTTLRVVNKHQIDLAATISYLDQAVQGYSSVGYSFDVPNQWANIFVQSLGPAGVDGLIGQCGAVDEFFDAFFGADCEGFPRAGTPTAEGAPGTSGDAPAAEGVPIAPELPVEPPPLPSGIDDIVSGVLDPVEETVEGVTP